METLKTLLDITCILKEEIKRIRFVAEDVLVSEDQKKIRKGDLQRAMILGNSEKCKSKIIFATNEGLKKVETTVWAIDDSEVILKAGIFIPIRAICHVAMV